ncbi:uncharacterized protein LOC112200986 [Rosa chinensis]|uniref:uncharacterized protein LOC112200986 n=1 Tax=Rosa chinensis TaxID=74649 RepID=UPI000D0935D0|nr:uncharacterized protein LOC112200986 [Rosa chinensis]
MEVTYSFTLSNALKEWNFNVFGNVFRKKKRLLARLNGIQKALSIYRNPFLVNVENQLIKDYEVIRDQEALLWQQKSRDKWLKDGDKNTEFFHLTTLVLRRRNKIEGLLNEEDVLYHDLLWLKRSISETEVKCALFGIGGLKTPGADGFPAAFCQKHWDLCATEIVHLVKNSFISGVLPAGLNHTS